MKQNEQKMWIPRAHTQQTQHTQRTSKQEPAANGQMGARITMSMRNVKRSESGENNNNSEEEWNVKNLVKDWMRLGHVRP